jgi:hypothetical protein
MGAEVADGEQLRILEQGVKAWNAWRLLTSVMPTSTGPTSCSAGRTWDGPWGEPVELADALEFVAPYLPQFRGEMRAGDQTVWLETGSRAWCGRRSDPEVRFARAPRHPPADENVHGTPSSTVMPV